MMFRRLLVALAALSLTVALVAPATAASKPKPKDPEQKVFDFEGDTVEAEFLKPNSGLIESVIRDERRSLIKIRLDFVDEIVQSAEEL